jgi:acyl-CoA thioesterase I
MNFIKINLAIIASFVLCISCQKNNTIVITPETPVIITKDTVRYLALGDSYTIGQSVLEADRYPVQLKNMLQKEGVLINNPKIIAKTGWRTDNLSSAMDAAKLDSNWTLVTLLIGVNNQYQGQNVSLYEKPFRQLLQRAVALAKGKKERVFVVSIPDYAYTPFGENSGNQANISKELDAYNVVNEQVAKEMGVTYFNITPISREGLKNPDLVANDGLHPSGKMYGRWVDLMFPEIKKRLQ